MMFREGSALSSPWDIWFSKKLFLDQINAWNLSEVAFRSGPQTFIQSRQKNSPVSNLKNTAEYKH